MRFYLNPQRSRGIAYQAGDGKLLWDGKVGLDPWMLNGTMLITQHRTALDIRTRKVIKSFARSNFGKGCNYIIGNAHILVQRQGAVMYVDLDANTAHRLWVRAEHTDLGSVDPYAGARRRERRR